MQLLLGSPQSQNNIARAVQIYERLLRVMAQNRAEVLAVGEEVDSGGMCTVDGSLMVRGPSHTELHGEQQRVVLQFLPFLVRDSYVGAHGHRAS